MKERAMEKIILQTWNLTMKLASKILTADCLQAGKKHRLDSQQTLFADIVCRCVLAVTFDVISHTISTYDEYKSKIMKRSTMCIIHPFSI